MTTTSIGQTLPPQNPGAVAVDPSAIKVSRGQAISAMVMPIALLLIVGFFAVASSGNYLSAQNLSQLAIELSITAVLALGMLLVILPGHIDLSAGSGVGLIGGIAAVLITSHGWPAWAAMAAGTAAGLLIWWGMGMIIIKERVPAFIITLSGLLIFRGLHLLVIKNSTVPIVPGGQSNIYSLLTTYRLSPMVGLILTAVIGVILITVAIAQRRSSGTPGHGETMLMRAIVISQCVLLLVLICNGNGGLPLPVVILGTVTVATWFLTRHTPFGRYLYAIGGNEEAAIVSGLPVHAITVGAFAIMGLLTALTGFLQTAYTGSSTTTIGNLMELDAVAACVIGGTSLRGGRGTVGGVLLGSLIIAALLNGMGLLGVSPEKKLIARGTVLALAVWADVRLRKQ